LIYLDFFPSESVFQFLSLYIVSRAFVMFQMSNVIKVLLLLLLQCMIMYDACVIALQIQHKRNSRNINADPRINNTPMQTTGVKMATQSMTVTRTNF